jgi:hypothetical protein
MASLPDDQSHLTPQEIERIAHEQAEQARKFATAGTENTYSNMGPKGAYVDDQTVRNDQDPLADDDNAADRQNYGYQDQFGDVDDQDPFNNLDEPDLDNRSLEEDEGLYGLAEPLAGPGDHSRQGIDKDRAGTEQSQDQKGYQQ